MKIRTLLSSTVSSLAALVLVAGCGTTDANSTRTTKDGESTVKAAAPQLTGSEIKTQSLEGCLWLSGDGKQVACLHHVYDMGENATLVSFHPLSGGAANSKHTIFSGEEQQPGAVKAEAVATVNRLLREGAFRLAGKHGEANKGSGVRMATTNGVVEVTAKGKRASLKVPPLPASHGEQGVRCCKFGAHAVTTYSDTPWVAVAFDVDCNYKTDPADKADACYLEGYNDESRPLNVAFGFAPLK